MKKFLAADIGFGSTGMAIFCFDKGWRIFDAKCLHTSKRNDSGSVTLDDIRRVEFLATGITNYYIENGCSAMACELPSSGAQSAKAQKAMSAAVSLIATCRLFLRAPALWITPNESRAAAGWDSKFHPVDPALKGSERKKALNERTKALKAFIMREMTEKFPLIGKFKDADKEHIADACSTFLAAEKKGFLEEI